MQANALRGLLTEYGEIMPQGKAGIRNGVAAALARLELRLLKIVIEALHEQWMRIIELSAQITQIECKLQSWLRTDASAKAITEVPGRFTRVQPGHS